MARFCCYKVSVLRNARGLSRIRLPGRRLLGTTSLAVLAALSLLITGAAAGAPAATSSPATQITQTGATLNGTVATGGEATTWVFQYGTDASFTTFLTAPLVPGSVDGSVASQPVSQTVTGLAPATTYYYRLVANNGSGTSTSSSQSFSTRPQPAISISDVAAQEGNTGLTPFVFTVTLSEASSQTVTVNYSTSGSGQPNSATAGTDYNGVSGTLTFAPGETAKTITVNVIGDDEPEAYEETFLVNLTAPVNATIADGQGLGRIQNDDGPLISITDVSAPEGTGIGVTPFQFTVSLSAPSGTQVRVDYVTAVQVGGYAADAGSDFQPASGTLTWAPGDATPRTITINVVKDSTEEPNELFYVVLRFPFGARFGDNVGAATILNDDGVGPPPPPPPPPAPPPPPPPLEAPIVSTTVRVISGFVTISLRCDPRARTACEGVLTLTAPVRGGTLVLGRGEFFIDPGATDPVQVALNKRGRRYVAAARRVRATARAVAKDGAGKPIDTSRVITLTTRAAAAPKLAVVATSSARVRGGLVSLRVTCAPAADGACSGSVTLRARYRGRLTAIGSGQFLMNEGRTQTVLVALTARGRALVAGNRALRVEARISARDDAGKRSLAVRRIVLRR